jgi:ADP-ribosylglycohydrolase
VALPKRTNELFRRRATPNFEIGTFAYSASLVVGPTHASPAIGTGAAVAAVAASAAAFDVLAAGEPAVAGAPLFAGAFLFVALAGFALDIMQRSPLAAS